MKSIYERRHSRWYEIILLGMPLHLSVGLLLVVFIPSLERWGWGFWSFLPNYRLNTILAISGSFVLVALTLRNVSSFPGSKLAAYILPTITFVFMLSVMVLFFSRSAYTRQVIFHSYLISLLWFFAWYFLGRRYRRLKIAIVPFGNVADIDGFSHIDWRWLSDPDLNGLRVDAVVADLSSDSLSPDWERFLAVCTLCRIPVYNVKQIRESISGRIKIDRLSENEFGSLLPSYLYQNFKLLCDFLLAIIILPFFLPLMALIAILIKIDSPGPVIYLQPRMGYRAIPFNMYKFRSMLQDHSGEIYTVSQYDPRITRVGRFLRKYRIDEIPQVINVLKCEMSFIGPRPESMELSVWYDKEVPFFSYRHVVRPGISGWAQVEQGYAAEVDGMKEKLQYDFYYIKNFSLWLDVLIVFKTLKTMFTGFGAR